MSETPDQWQAAWSVVAGIAGAAVIGLVVARITANVPMTPIIILGVVLVVSLYLVFSPIWHLWPLRHRSKATATKSAVVASPASVGIRQTGGTAFHEALEISGVDVGIDQSGGDMHTLGGRVQGAADRNGDGD